MKKKGFTLVELLVVIAIIALLMGILMPALARVRAIAFRMVCGSNLSGIGKAILIYANDYDDELPKAGIQGSRLILSGAISNWRAPERDTAFANGNVTISSCFYLLIRYSEVTPKSFICKGDPRAKEFKLSDTGLTATELQDIELIDLWDFGPLDTGNNRIPANCCSYSYHQPLQRAGDTSTTAYSYALTTSSDPGMAVAADRNPWFCQPVEGNFSAFNPLSTDQDLQRMGNSASHGTNPKEGQNVLFMDSHVYFEKRSYCAIDDDNIYTFWGGTAELYKKKGSPQPATGNVRSQGKADSLLVNNMPN